MNRLAFVLPMLFLAAFSMSSVAAELSRFSSVRLTRGSCEGNCPTYWVEIHNDGEVIFDGPTGVKHGKVPRSNIELLSRVLGRASPTSSSPQFTDQVAACSNGIMDFPVSFVDVTTSKTSYRLQYNPGCRQIPNETKIGWLGDTIDELAGTEQWLNNP